jgi:prepilin-type N-terminal cleavage/methylation domain-containing protein
MRNFKKGFTLIELLVVIAIIGVLSAVVLASLNTARSKGNDAAVMSDLDGIRTQAQLYYGGNGNSYANVCTEETVVKQIAGAETANGSQNTVVCNIAVDGSAYAVSSGLLAYDPVQYYCIDSTGVGTTTLNALGAATACQ